MKNRESKSYRATDKISSAALVKLRKRCEEFEEAYMRYLKNQFVEPSDTSNDEPDPSDYGLTGEQARKVKRLVLFMLKEEALG